MKTFVIHSISANRESERVVWIFSNSNEFIYPLGVFGITSKKCSNSISLRSWVNSIYSANKIWIKVE